MPMVRCGNNENDRIYDAIVARGVTPASDSTEDLIAAIALIDTKHRVGISTRYRGDSSIELTVTVDSGTVYHATADNPSYSMTV